MTDLTDTDLDLLHILDAYAAVGGRPLQMPGTTTRGEQRLVAAGLAIVRGDRLCITRDGVKVLEAA